MAHLIYLNSYEMNLSDLSHSQICQRVRSVICEAVWSVWESEVRGRTRPHRFESPIGLSRTAGDAVRSSAKCIASAGRGATGPGSDCIARCAWEADRTLKSVRPCACAWEAVGSRARPLTSDSQTDHMTLCMRGRSDSQICEAVCVCDRTLPAEAMRLAVKSVRRARGWQHRPCAWEADRQRSERPCAWEAVLPWLAQTDHMTKVRGRERPLINRNTLKMPENLTFDSNSTSDRFYQMC